MSIVGGPIMLSKVAPPGVTNSEPSTCNSEVASVNSVSAPTHCHGSPISGLPTSNGGAEVVRLNVSRNSISTVEIVI